MLLSLPTAANTSERAATCRKRERASTEPHWSPTTIRKRSSERAEVHAWFRTMADLIEQGRQAWIENDYYNTESSDP